MKTMILILLAKIILALSDTDTMITYYDANCTLVGSLTNDYGTIDSTDQYVACLTFPTTSTSVRLMTTVYRVYTTPDCAGTTYNEYRYNIDCLCTTMLPVDSGVTATYSGYPVSANNLRDYFRSKFSPNTYIAKYFSFNYINNCNNVTFNITKYTVTSSTKTLQDSVFNTNIFVDKQLVNTTVENAVAPTIQNYASILSDYNLAIEKLSNQIQIVQQQVNNLSHVAETLGNRKRNIVESSGVIPTLSALTIILSIALICF